MFCHPTEGKPRIQAAFPAVSRQLVKSILRTCLVLLSAFCAVGIARSQGAESIDLAWLAKAKTEAKAAYDRYVALSPHLEAESEVRYDKMPGSVGKMPFRASTHRIRVVRLNDEMIYEQIRTSDNAPKKPQILLQCDNSDYHFSLSKSSEEASYSLGEYVPGKRKLPLVIQQPGMHNYAFSHIPRILTVIGNDGEYSLKRLQFDKAKGLLLVEHTFSAGKDLAAEQFSLDPSHGWRIVDRKVEDLNMVTTERWSYGVMVDGLEFPSEYKNQTIYKVAEAPPNMEITGRLLSLKITDKTREAFRLSAFGLPEPIDAPPLPRPTPWYLWIMAASGACAAIAIGFAYLRRRSQRAAV